MSFIRSKAFRNKAINCQGLMFFSSSVDAARSPTTIRIVSGSLSQISSGPASPSFSPVYDVSIKIMDGSSPDANITAEANIIKILTSSIAGRTLDNENQLRDLLVKAINGESSGSFIVFPSSGNGSDGIHGLEAFPGNSVFKNDSVSRQKTISLQAEVAGKDAELRYRFYNSDGLGIFQFNTLEHGFDRISQRQFDALSGKKMRKGTLVRTLDHSFTTGTMNTDYLSDMRQGVDINSYDALFDSLFAKVRSNSSFALTKDGKLPDATVFDANRFSISNFNSQLKSAHCILALGWGFVLRMGWDDRNASFKENDLYGTRYVKVLRDFVDRRISMETWRVRNFWSDKRITIVDGFGNLRIFRFLAGPLSLANRAAILRETDDISTVDAFYDYIPETGELDNEGNIIIQLGIANEWYLGGQGYEDQFIDAPGHGNPRRGQGAGVVPRVAYRANGQHPALPKVPSHALGSGPKDLYLANPELPTFEFISKQIVKAINIEYERDRQYIGSRVPAHEGAIFGYDYGDVLLNPRPFSIRAKLKASKFASTAGSCDIMGQDGSNTARQQNSMWFANDFYHYVLLEHDAGPRGNYSFVDFNIPDDADNIGDAHAMATPNDWTGTDTFMHAAAIGSAPPAEYYQKAENRGFNQSLDRALKIIPGKSLEPITTQFLSQPASTAYSSLKTEALGLEPNSARFQEIHGYTREEGRYISVGRGLIPVRFSGGQCPATADVGDPRGDLSSSLQPIRTDVGLQSSPHAISDLGKGKMQTVLTHVSEKRDLGMPSTFSPSPFKDRQDINQPRYSVKESGYGPRAGRDLSSCAIGINAIFNGGSQSYTRQYRNRYNLGHNAGPFYGHEVSSFSIEVPVLAGGTGRKVTISLQNSLPVAAADTIYINLGFGGSLHPIVKDEMLKNYLMAAINGIPSDGVNPTYIRFASSGDGINGIKGITALPGRNTSRQGPDRFYPGRAPASMHSNAVADRQQHPYIANQCITLRLDKPGDFGSLVEFQNITGWAPFQGYPFNYEQQLQARFRGGVYPYQLTSSVQLLGGANFDEFHPGAYMIRANDPEFVLTRSEDGTQFMKRGPGITDELLPQFLADINNLSSKDGTIDVFDTRDQVERTSIEGPFFARGARGSFGQIEDHYRGCQEISFGKSLKDPRKPDTFYDVGIFSSVPKAERVIDMSFYDTTKSLEGDRYEEWRFFVPKTLGGTGRDTIVRMHSNHNFVTGAIRGWDGLAGSLADPERDDDVIYVFDYQGRDLRRIGFRLSNSPIDDRTKMFIKAVNGELNERILYPKSLYGKGVSGLLAYSASNGPDVGKGKISLRCFGVNLLNTGELITIESLTQRNSIRKRGNPHWPSFKMGEYAAPHGLKNMDRAIQSEDFDLIIPFTDIRHSVEKIYNEDFLDKKLLKVISEYSGSIAADENGRTVLVGHSKKRSRNVGVGDEVFVREAYLEGPRALPEFELSTMIPILPLREKKELLDFSDFQNFDKMCLTGYQYENSPFSVDSIAFGGLKK